MSGEKKTYEVKIPFAGYVVATVEADNEEDARDLAWEKADFKITLENPDDVFVGEVETLDHIVRGNVCSAPVNSLSVEELSKQEG